MAQIQKGTTYITGDQVTAANLNALADSAILLAGAITDQTAKTVPLAADTVLIHSAADTALRKSTLTQVFANATGIPISTGISGLGTGVATALAVNVGSAGAPVVNGGALGVPTSGTVTNLTGTASINTNGAHNGTVGATTASTGAFTTLSASTSGSFSGAGLPYAANSLMLRNNGTGDSQLWALGPNTSTNGTMTIVTADSDGSATATVGVFSSTGLAVTGALSSTTGANFATSSGNVGIGTSSPGAQLDISTTVAATGAILRLSNQANTIGVNEPHGTIEFFSGDDSGPADAVVCSIISAQATTSPNDGYLKFLTGNNTERVRIDSSGNLLVGTTSAYDGDYRGLQATNSAGGDCAVFTTTGVTGNIIRWNKATSGDNDFLGFYTETSITSRGAIKYNRSVGLVAYNTTSDYRAKDILGPVQNSGATIDALKVYEGQMKGATKSRPMLVAHEAQEHAPYTVTGEKDAVNEDGTPNYQQMDVSALVPLLLAELQSVRARLAALESK